MLALLSKSQMEGLNSKLAALEEELRTKSNALQASILKINRMEENHQSDIDHLNIDVQHFKTLYEDLSRVLKSQEK